MPQPANELPGHEQPRCVCRELLSTELVALVGESYERAYPDLVRAQQCAELTEVIQHLKSESIQRSLSGLAPPHRGGGGYGGAAGDPLAEASERHTLIREAWRARLMGVERSVDAWTGLLAVRRLVLAPSEDVEVYLKFAVMCRKEGQEQLAWRTLTKLLSYDPLPLRKGEPGYGGGSGNPMVRAALWPDPNCACSRHRHL
jgi:serine/threonine-protein kinase mTOR